MRYYFEDHDVAIGIMPAHFQGKQDDNIQPMRTLLDATFATAQTGGTSSCCKPGMINSGSGTLGCPWHKSVERLESGHLEVAAH